jgi:tripartite-type tricarboxylate transporter receptor subunit TctC
VTLSRRTLLQSTSASAFLASLGASLGTSAFAQNQIETLKIVTGFAAGGTSDTLCRRVATRMAPDYAKTAVVENKTGAGGQIAVTTVKGAAPDGATMLQTPTSILTIYPHIYKKLPYDPIADLTPVSVACVFDFGFAVGPAVPANVKTVADFVTWVKANPKGGNFGSPAAGSTPHFVGALLGKSTGIDLTHTAYRGTQPAMLDLLGGNISAVSGPIGDITQHLASGKIRILATSGAQRNRFAPDVPTFAEQGLKELTHSEWFSFFLPAKASPEVVNRLNAALKTALAQKDVIDGLHGFGLEAMWTTPADLADLIRKDTAKWAPIVKAVGFSADA